MKASSARPLRGFADRDAAPRPREARVAKATGSKAPEADATQTALWTWLPPILLGGLLLNALVGWR
jgi:hypothetical protein